MLDANEILDVQSAEALTEYGRRVIIQEADALLALATRINTQFARACHFLLACKGRIIVTGIGKSGHIGRKIAATFASTGSPAFFLHPAEAKHGDAGVITVNDVIILLSYSGESEEVLAILPLIKYLKIPLIALTGHANSSLAKAATVNVDIKVEREACALNLAPTSSTTVALAMGDALAMTIAKERGLTVEQFAMSHPGGALGRRLLLTVNELMHVGDAMPIVSENIPIKSTLMEMTHKRLGMLMILDAERNLMGIFTDGDLRRVLNQDLDIQKTTIGQMMNRQPRTVHSGTLVADAMHVMKAFKITVLIVVDDVNKPLGVLHMHDVLRVGIS